MGTDGDKAAFVTYLNDLVRSFMSLHRAGDSDIGSERPAYLPEDGGLWVRVNTDNSLSLCWYDGVGDSVIGTKTAAGVWTLNVPLATASAPGIARPDGVTVTVDNGVLSAAASGGTAGAPAGGIIPFSGSFGGSGNKYPLDRYKISEDNPTGINYEWGLCDGTSFIAPDGVTIVTPDLRGKFILAPDDSHAAGTTGGGPVSVTVGGRTLSTNQMPSHAHQEQGSGWNSAAPLSWGQNINGSQSGRNMQTAEWSDSMDKFNLNTANAGGGGSHDHTATAANALPPYYALAYIMRL
jgi:microcystin-dependent protein